MKHWLITLLLVILCIGFNDKPVYSDVNTAGQYQLTIKHKPDGYYLNGKLVDVKLMDKLLAAVNEPIIKELGIPKLGINQSWLNENAKSALQEHLSYCTYIKPSSKQKDLFINSFKNLRLIEKVLHDYYESFWTDDYPKFSLKIVEADGNTITIYSDDQHTFMIPWQITKGGKTETTYNVDISKTICLLLPETFGRGDIERICGNNLRREIADGLLYEIRNEWDKLEVEDKFSKEIAVIKNKYTLITSAIETVSSIDLGSDSPFASSTGWNATMTRKDLPSNVLIGLHVPIEGGNLTSLKPFLEKSDYYTDLALSVPWFAKYIKEHPKTGLEIRFVKDRSMSNKAKESLLNDMEEHGKKSLADKIAGLLKDSCFLEINEGDDKFSRWIVLPDKRMLLWHFKGNQVLNRDSSKFKTWEDYGFSIACAVISTDGEIVTNP